MLFLHLLVVLLPLPNLLCTFDPTPLSQCGRRILCGTIALEVQRLYVSIPSGGPGP